MILYYSFARFPIGRNYKEISLYYFLQLQIEPRIISNEGLIFAQNLLSHPLWSPSHLLITRPHVFWNHLSLLSVHEVQMVSFMGRHGDSDLISLLHLWNPSDMFQNGHMIQVGTMVPNWTVQLQTF